MARARLPEAAQQKGSTEFARNITRLSGQTWIPGGCNLESVLTVRIVHRIPQVRKKAIVDVSV